MHLIDLALYGWVPFTLLLFILLPPRRAVLAGYIGAWLFLPMRTIPVNVLPDIDKVTISSFGVLLGIVLFDSARLTLFRPRWFDLPMFVWCTTPFVSSMVNKLGPWDGASAVIAQLVLWGIPYFIGRIYFTDWLALRELAVAIFVGGLIYVPLCLFEIKMSPVLHLWVYGYRQHNIAQAHRFGGWRPMVFMQHGLAVGFWMTAASLMGVWLWQTGSMRRLGGAKAGGLVASVVVTTVLCKAMAGLMFLLMGLGTLYWMRNARNAIPLCILLAVAPLYMVLRASGMVTGEYAVRVATSIFGEERAQSLDFRLNAENLLTKRALEAPFFGWGRWDPEDTHRPKWRVYDEETGKDLAVTDGMWVITMGTCGLVGLASATLVVLMPAVLLLRRVPPGYWAHPIAAAPAALAVLLTLHMMDNLLNAMLNPVYVVAIGGICALGGSASTAMARSPVAVPAYGASSPPRPGPAVGRYPQSPRPVAPAPRPAAVRTA